MIAFRARTPAECAKVRESLKQFSGKNVSNKNYLDNIENDSFRICFYVYLVLKFYMIFMIMFDIFLS